MNRGRVSSPFKFHLSISLQYCPAFKTGWVQAPKVSKYLRQERDQNPAKMRGKFKPMEMRKKFCVTERLVKRDGDNFSKFLMRDVFI